MVLFFESLLSRTLDHFSITYRIKMSTPTHTHITATGVHIDYISENVIETLCIQKNAFKMRNVRAFSIWWRCVFRLVCMHKMWYDLLFVRSFRFHLIAFSMHVIFRLHWIFFTLYTRRLFSGSPLFIFLTLVHFVNYLFFDFIYAILNISLRFSCLFSFFIHHLSLPTTKRNRPLNHHTNWPRSI